MSKYTEFALEAYEKCRAGVITEAERDAILEAIEEKEFNDFLADTSVTESKKPAKETAKDRIDKATATFRKSKVAARSTIFNKIPGGESTIDMIRLCIQDGLPAKGKLPAKFFEDGKWLLDHYYNKNNGIEYNKEDEREIVTRMRRILTNYISKSQYSEIFTHYKPTNESVDAEEALKKEVNTLKLCIYEACDKDIIDEDTKKTFLEYLDLDNYEKI